MKWLPATDITIDIAVDRVTFMDTDTEPLVWPPRVYLAVDSSRFKVLSVGTPPPLGTPAQAVELFESEGPPRGFSKLDCLAAFFMKGLKVVIDRHLFRVRPQVLVRGAETVSRSLGGYERDLLTHALRQAGAKEVQWPDDLS